MKKNKILIIAAMAATLCGCDSMLDIDDPSSSMPAETTFNTLEGIKAAETGLYSQNFLNNRLYYSYIDQYFPMYADEMTHSNLSYSEYYANSYDASTDMAQYFWQYAYQSIYQSNDFLIRIDGTTLIDDATLKAYEGEAMWFRAYDYMFLVNAYGDVPLVMSNNYEETGTMARTPKAEVWAQIVSDLTTARDYLHGFSNGKTRITEYAATALLARAYLYQEQWQQAVTEASRLIPSDDGGQGEGGFQLDDVDKVFKSSSTEAISQSDCEGFYGTGTYIGYTPIGNYILPSSRSVSYRLTSGLVNALKSEEGDKRMNWIDSMTLSGNTYYYPYKYKYNTTPNSESDYEYYVFLRLGEMYLIRAEANAHLGNTAAAVRDLNIIRNRAGLPALSTSLSQSQVLSAVETERRKELFCEQGHRWFDLNRTGRADAVYSALDYKTGWESYKSLLPIPELEIEKNEALTQNPGYGTINE